mgnify:CR=1 FL=1
MYLYITIILSFIGWTGLARTVRGRFIALRKEDFVMAAKLAGVIRAEDVDAGLHIGLALLVHQAVQVPVAGDEAEELILRTLGKVNPATWLPSGS